MVCLDLELLLAFADLYFIGLILHQQPGHKFVVATTINQLPLQNHCETEMM